MLNHIAKGHLKLLESEQEISSFLKLTVLLVREISF